MGAVARDTWYTLSECARGHCMCPSQAWGIALKKLTRLLSPDFQNGNADAQEENADRAYDENALRDWFEIEDERSGHLNKRFVVLDGSEVVIHREANGTGCVGVLRCCGLHRMQHRHSTLHLPCVCVCDVTLWTPGLDVAVVLVLHEPLAACMRFTIMPMRVTDLLNGTFHCQQLKISIYSV